MKELVMFSCFILIGYISFGQTKAANSNDTLAKKKVANNSYDTKSEKQSLTKNDSLKLKSEGDQGINYNKNIIPNSNTQTIHTEGGTYEIKTIGNDVYIKEKK